MVSLNILKENEKRNGKNKIHKMKWYRFWKTVKGYNSGETYRSLAKNFVN